MLRIVQRSHQRIQGDRIRDPSKPALRRLALRRRARKGPVRRVSVPERVTCTGGLIRHPLRDKRIYACPGVRRRYNPFTLALYGPSKR